MPKRRAGPKPGGKIWFIGGPLDNRLEVIRPWHKTFRVAMPLGILAYAGHPANEAPCCESVYYLSRLCSQGSAIFDAYVHESITNDQLAARVYIEAPVESNFVIYQPLINLDLKVKR